MVQRSDRMNEYEGSKMMKGYRTGAGYLVPLTAAMLSLPACSTRPDDGPVIEDDYEGIAIMMEECHDMDIPVSENTEGTQVYIHMEDTGESVVFTPDALAGNIYLEFLGYRPSMVGVGPFYDGLSYDEIETLERYNQEKRPGNVVIGGRHYSEDPIRERQLRNETREQLRKFALPQGFAAGTPGKGKR